MESGFLFATCQVGAEAALKQEVARAHPELRPAFARPGFVTFKSLAGPVGPDFRIESVFARAYGASLGDIAPEAVAEAWGAPVRLHAWSPELDASVRAAGPGLFLDGTRARAGEKVLDVLDEPRWVGAHVHDARRSPWPAGAWPVEVPADAPSRAYRKLEEAIAWSGARVGAGQVAVEIGSAPGGASYALLRRGLSVVGVDPGAMAPVVLGFEGPSGNRFRHLQIPVGALRREMLPAAVDWLLLDVHLAPQVALHAVRRIVAPLRRHLRGVFFTLKLNDWSMAALVPALIARVEGMGLVEVRATQLPSAGQEICVTATSGSAARPGRRPAGAPSRR